MKMQMSPVAKFFLYVFLVLVTALTLFPLLYTISASVKTNGDIANGKPNLIPSREKSVYERNLNNGDPIIGTINTDRYEYDMLGHVTDRKGTILAVDNDGFLLSDPKKNVFRSEKGEVQNAKFLPGYHRNEDGEIVDPSGNIVIVNARGQILDLTDKNIYIRDESGNLIQETKKDGSPKTDNKGNPVYAINEEDFFRAANGKVFNQGDKQEVIYNEEGYIYKTVMEKYLWVENYRKVWTMSGSGYTDTTNFADYTFNSLKVSALTVVITVIFTAMSAYCFQRGRFPGKTFLYWFFMATMFIGAGTITVFPILRITTTIGMNTWWGLAIVVGATGGASNLFLTMGYLKTIPKELDESAKIDGCTFFSTWWRVILPLSIPILGTIALMTFRGSWNNWMLPRLMLASDQTATTLVVAIVNLANNGGAGASQYNLMMAGSMLSMAPMLIMFLIMNETFVEGITQGSVKG